VLVGEVETSRTNFGVGCIVEGGGWLEFDEVNEEDGILDFETPSVGAVVDISGESAGEVVRIDGIVLEKKSFEVDDGSTSRLCCRASRCEWAS